MSVPQPDLAGLVAAQIGRPLRSSVTVSSTCTLGLPTSVRVPPFLDDGTPFPTTFWLSCPLAVRRIGRLEATGAVKQLQNYAKAHPDFGDAIDARHEAVAQERRVEVGDADGPTPSGGVAGVRTGIKCLHAHYGDFLGNGSNPVGEVTDPFVAPLDCPVPCVVVSGDGDWERNNDWFEPK